MRISKIFFLFLLLQLLLSAFVEAGVYPNNHMNVQDSSINFAWNPIAGATGYEIQVTSGSFSSPLIDLTGITSNTDSVKTLIFGSYYYWRVRATGSATWSQVDTFAYFNAAGFPNLSLWLRADGKVLKDAGNNVGGWVNEAPNANDTAIQTVQTKKPLWASDVYCNRPMLEFNSSKSQDLYEGGGYHNIGSNSETMFCVGQAFNTSYTYYSKTEYAAQPNRYGLWADGSNIYSLLDDNNAAHNVQFPLNKFSTPTGLSTYEIVLNRNTGNNSFYYDDFSLGTASGILSSSYNILSNYIFYIGAYDAASGQTEQPGLYLNGNIAEILFYDSAFSNTQRTMVSQYLMDKYDPPVNLGPNVIVNNFCPDTLKTSGCYTAYVWSTGASTASIIATTPGTYYVTATDVFFRNSVDSIDVIEPNPNFTGANTKICFGDTVVWNTGLDSTVFTFLWSNGSKKSYLDISVAGTYSVTVTGPGGCTLASTPVTFTVDSFKLQTSLGAVHSFCTGNLLQLQQGAALVSHYQWSTGAGDTLPYITIDSAGLYSVTLTDDYGCTTVDSINITIKGVGPVSNFKADTVCLGAPTQFTDLSTIPNPYTITAWLWKFGDGAGSTLQDPTHIYPSAGIYNDTLTTTANTGCISTPTIHQVLVRPTVQAFFTDSMACTGDSTRFFDASTAAPGDTLVSWYWNFNGIGSSTQENSKFKFPAVGIDTVSLAVSTYFGCRDTFKRAVDVVSSANPPGAFSLLAPINNANLIDKVDTFTWQTSANAVRYILKIASDPNLNNIVFSNSIYSPKDSTSSLPTGYTVFYWEVIAFNLCGDSVASQIDSFTVFNPSYYLGSNNNPSFWVMADGPLLKHSGNFVTQWTDQSGNGNNVYENNGDAVSPVWDSVSSPILNNRPVLNFNGADSLYGIDSTVLNLHNHSRTAFVIGRSRSQSGGTYFAKSYYGPGASRYSVFWSNGELESVCEGPITNSPSNPIITPSPPVGNYEMVTWIADRNITNLSTIIENSIDSGTAAAPNVPSSNYNFTSPWNFLVGAQGYGNFSPGELTTLQLNGNIAEIIFFDTLLNTQDYNMVKRYLYLKYGGGPVYLGPDINIPYGFCDHIVLDASNRYVYYSWSNDSTTQTISTATGGAYSVTVTDVFGQVYTSSININRPGIHLPGDTIFCLGDSLNLNVNLGGGYHYLFSTGDTVPSIYVKTPGKYWVTITDTISPVNGGPCSISDTINIRVDSFRVLATLGPDTTICRGQYIGLQTEAATAATYYWSDGSTGDSLVVDSSGTYAVTVTSVNGCVANSSIYVNTSGAIANVAFDINPAYCIGDTVDFQNQTTIISPFQILDYQWAFGDATGIDTAGSPTHYYAQPGTYTVTLTVGADSGCVKSLSQTLVVNPLPDDSFTYKIGCADALMDFRNQSISSFTDPIEHWTWNFGDSIGIDTMTNPQYIYAQPGIYPVALTVTTLTGCKSTFIDTVQVFPQLIISIGANNLCEGQTVQFHDASPGFSNVAWLWQFPDNTSATDSNPVKSFNPTGQYVILLTVTNAIGCVVTDTDTITIFNPPVANFDNPNGCIQFPYQFSDLSTATPGDSLQSRIWNFGDSSAVSIKHRPQHLYADTGTYDVTLTVTTEHGCQDSITKPVELLGPPQAAFTFSPNFGGAPININFTNETTGAINYLWNFGDGDTSTDENPSHTYIQDGAYIIHLISYNSVGCSDTATDSVNVVPASLDLAILYTNVTQDSAGEYNLCAFIINVGTRTVYNFDIVASLGGGSTIIEHVMDTLKTGDTITYCFHSHYFVTAPANETYICIYTENPDDGVDQNPSNNIICTTLQNDIHLMPPYPNPAGKQVTFGAVLPSNEPLSVLLYDELGKKLATVFSGTGVKGLNQWNVDLSPYPDGGYFFLVTYKQEVLTVKFVIAR